MPGIEDSIVCYLEQAPGEPSLELSESDWVRILARRRELGRPLTRAEVSAIVVAEEGDDRDA